MTDQAEIESTESNQVPSMSPASAPVNKPVVIIMACVLASTVLLYFFNKDSSPSTFRVTSTPTVLFTETKQSPNLEQIRSAVLSKAVLIFPRVTGSQIIDRARVPEDLKFILRNEDSKVLKRKYENGSEGYEFSLDVNLSLFAAHNLYRSSVSPKEGWEVLSAMRGRLFGVVEAGNSSNRLRVNLTTIDENRTLVIVETISIQNQL